MRSMCVSIEGEHALCVCVKNGLLQNEICALNEGVL